MDKPVIKEAIVVEGRYDKNTLSQIVDALILETNGFQLYHDRTLRDNIRSAAERTGIIILTDSDASGFQIRSRIKAFVPENLIKNAYIPDIYGKEKRKSTPGKEGKLGVEGMSREVLLNALKAAGATFSEEEKSRLSGEEITVADLYAAGLTGRPDSRERRTAFLKKYGLPEHLGTRAAAQALSRLLSREAFLQSVQKSENNT